MSQSTSNVNNLFQTAHEEGDLSTASLQMLQVADIGAAIQGALGVTVDQVTASEVLLEAELVDDSGSIRMAGNSQYVRDGHNLVLDSLGGSKQKNSILSHCRYLTGPKLPGGVLYPYVPLDQAVRMTAQNYNPCEGTPLFDQSVVFLGTVLAKCQEFADNGMVARTCSLIISDGADEHSVKHTARDVAKLVADLLKQERHIVAAMGIDDGVTDFYQVFSGRTRSEVEQARQDGTLDDLQPAPGGMGILPKWVLTPGSTASDIRKAFQLFSQSAVRASQAAGAAFSKVAMGGFTN